MADNEDRAVVSHNAPVTPQRIRAAAAQAELRGDWTEYELMMSAADRILQLEAQNQAYRHALASGVSINLVAKRKWFRVNQG